MSADAEVSTWFRDAKFGIWAHWGPQSVPMRGDWYARLLYGPYAGTFEKERERAVALRAFHEDRYGHPSEFGHQDVCREWKAERWDPEELLDLYVRVGARYFVSMGNHIDNFDLWDSAHQPWNAVNVGPQRDVVAIWAEGARRRGLPFGISFHANWTWRLMEPAFGADEDGPRAGVSYDGHRTPLLYDRARSPGEPPDPAFIDRFYRRAWDAVQKYRPQYVYWDDSRLPFDEGSVIEAKPPSRAGWDVLTRMLDASRGWHGEDGRLVATVKRLADSDGDALTLDVERGQLSDVHPRPWQNDTCLGHWFYEEGLRYKTARHVLSMLVDVVSKNGNLLLSVPQRPDGTIDDEEVAILTELGAWLDRFDEAIYGTRPWKVHGEGPTQAATGPFREPELAYTGDDVRFTAKGDVLYATLLGGPSGDLARIRSLGRAAGLLRHDPARVEVVGNGGELSWERHDASLDVRLPAGLPWAAGPVTLRISGAVE